MLFKSRSEMPLGIVAMGIVFNLLKRLHARRLDILRRAGATTRTSGCSRRSSSPDWLSSSPGMAINIHSDRIIRRLRKPGDTAHYLPRGGMFRYVTSANLMARSSNGPASPY